MGNSNHKHSEYHGDLVAIVVTSKGLRLAALLGLILGFGANEWRWRLASQEARERASAADTALNRLRADSAGLAERVAVTEAVSASQRHRADSLETQARVVARQNAHLARATRDATVRLDSARTASDSLLRYPEVVAALRFENGGLKRTLEAFDQVIAEKNQALRADSVEIVTLRQAKDNAESRAATLAQVNADLRKALSKPKALFRLPSLPTIGVAAVVVGGVCVATTVC